MNNPNDNGTYNKPSSIRLECDQKFIEKELSKYEQVKVGLTTTYYKDDKQVLQIEDDNKGNYFEKMRFINNEYIREYQEMALRDLQIKRLFEKEVSNQDNSLYYNDGNKEIALNHEKEHSLRAYSRSISAQDVVQFLILHENKHIESLPCNVEMFTEALTIIKDENLFDLKEITLGENIDKQYKRALKQVINESDTPEVSDTPKLNCKALHKKSNKKSVKKAKRKLKAQGRANNRKGAK